MWELDCKERWAPKNWCFWTVVLEKTPECPLDCKKMQPVHPKGNHSWMFTGRTDAEAETPILGHLMQRVDSFEKALMLGKIEGRRRRGWQRMRQLDGITNSRDMHMCGLQVGDGQGGLVCCRSWAHKSWTWLSNLTELNLLNILSDFFPFFSFDFLWFCFDWPDFCFSLENIPLWM